MNFSQAFEALNQGEPISIGNPITDGYLLMYQMVDKSIGKRMIIQKWVNSEKSMVYEPTQEHILSTNWRILKETEL